MRAFTIDVPESELDDLRRRLTATRWSDELPGVGWERGVPLAQLRDLADYWADGFDWRAVESRLNRFPQFRTEIDGQPIHFLHLPSPEPGALPLVLTHGWPGAFTEFVGIAEQLSDPRAHGGDPADAFHVVIPSLPGYGFSAPLRSTGWDVPRIAGAWSELMARLGYHRYGAQGGDAGSPISLALGMMHPEQVAGVHVNMLMTFPSGDPADFAGLSDTDQRRLAQLTRFDQHLSGYMRVMAQRPQTLGYSLSDSPVGLLAFIVEKFHEWTDPGEAVDRDTILTIVSLYWLTRTATSAGQFYYEGAEAVRQVAAGAAMPPVTVPVGVAVFPHDIFQPIRRFADRDLKAITRWTEFDRGGHFAALEQPGLLVDDVRAFFRSVR